MILTENQINRLRDAGVKLVYLFGSMAEGNNLGFSDIDIGVLLDPVLGNQTLLTDLYNSLYDLFTSVFPGKNIDLVLLNRASAEIKYDVVTHGKIIYFASIGDRLDFEEQTLLFYADFKPLLNRFDKAILERSTSL